MYSVVSVQRTMSEALSKQLLTPFGFPFAAEVVVSTAIEAGNAADAMGYPVVAKLNGDLIAHKTERGLVRLGLANRVAVEHAASELLSMATSDDGAVQLLIAKMINGSRELIVGMVRDPAFGKTAMLGVGGIFAEVIEDVVFAPMPIDVVAAKGMIEALKYQAFLKDFRGEGSVDTDALSRALVALSAACDAHPEIVSIDINPLIVQRDGTIVAVDALVEIHATDEVVLPASKKFVPQAEH